MKQQDENKELINALVQVSRALIAVSILFAVCVAIVIFTLLTPAGHKFADTPKQASAKPNQMAIVPSTEASAGTTPRRVPADAWKAPEESTIPVGKAGDAIRYGRELIAHTAQYFGPKGSVAMITNGMNCQNCHLAGGTKIFGNDYAGFISSYPKMSGRSGKVEPASERIAECFERSLAGKVPDTAGKEVQAILAYMKWIGKDVKKGQKLFGSATEKIAFMDHAADPEKGKEVFVMKCQSCHGSNGEGLLNADQKTYANPPLWGKHSYNDGAGMYRLTNLAGFVKNNMPFGATYQSPQLTDEEAWNVAAFINTQPRPHKDQHKDWTNLKKKPIDFPFGPYADGFSEKQHKLGPFKPIKDAQKELTSKKS
ncbi:c-type cytochrome [Mucilaginibacter gossypii]|uniref:c-type cytochrome n=1 Tax=Mucilaginibacter gossypii TaxID=551996 RepID=UPI000DCDC035|nr:MULTISPECIES: c-type cytochrome [Mucilaginibacter]QTE36351.1 c-type cytochrome [Mucilaginibacter gossypii]RAV60062.1 cytochrome C [Mucilaginibacter rubeus]